MVDNVSPGTVIRAQVMMSTEINIHLSVLSFFLDNDIGWL